MIAGTASGDRNWPFLTFTALPVFAAARSRSVCRQRKAAQRKYIDKVHDLFKDLQVVIVPLFPDEIKGVAALKTLMQVLFDKHKEPNREVT